MKDRPVMCVTEILDDDSGLYTDYVCDTSTDVGAVKRLLKEYGRVAYYEMVKCLDILRRDVENMWREMRENEEI